MKEFLFLFRGGDSEQAMLSPEDFQLHMKKWGKWIDELAQKDRYVAAQPLTKQGKHIKGLNKIVCDGPFIEGKEMVGGYLICRAESYDDAVKISMDCPILQFENGSVEIREIQLM